jgi:hypothetical protein
MNKYIFCITKALCAGDQNPMETLEMCLVCEERLASCVLLNCRHCVVCYVCADRVDFCPSCNNDVIRFVRIY